MSPISTHYMAHVHYTVCVCMYACVSVRACIYVSMYEHVCMCVCIVSIGCRDGVINWFCLLTVIFSLTIIDIVQFLLSKIIIQYHDNCHSS